MISQQERNQLLHVFQNVLNVDPKSTHNDLIMLYGVGIQHIKENYANRGRELKAAAMYALRLSYLKTNKLDTALPESIINDFFSLYDKEFETFKKGFELITDEEYLLLSFVYRKYNS